MQTNNQNPFLGLKPYELADRRKLYGRDKDLFLMKDRIFCARTSLLFAGSGVGKTSFINAKIIPELQGQYTIIYHNQWAVDQPLVGLLKAIRKQLPPDEETAQRASDPEVKKVPLFYVANSLRFYLNRFRKRATETGSRSSSRCLLVLDQFEEVFQHHSHKKYFDTFVHQLSGLINDEYCKVRVLFSMREEFLGELSIFDNQIPDLFSNYYRLKSPNKEEAFDIIDRTCNYVNVPVAEDRLELLVDDLTKIKAAAVATSNNHESQMDVDTVAPPYLQIACKKLWDQQFKLSQDSEPPATNGKPEEPPATNGKPEELQATVDKTEEPPAEADKPKFLAQYQVGDARSMLKSFCYEILKEFDKPDRELLAEAFNFLVTKQGAKLAYPLASLAEHMEVDEDSLKSVLRRLSDSRILRKSNGPDQAPWFELYHDMYGPIIDEWKRTYRQEQKAEQEAEKLAQRAEQIAQWKALRRKLATAAAVIVIVALLVMIVRYRQDKLAKLETTLSTADLSTPAGFRAGSKAFEELRNSWRSEDTARKLWAEAWVRRAREAEKNENGDDAFLSWLKAAEVAQKDQVDPTLRAQISSYLNTDQYERLLTSFRIDVGADTSPAFAPILTAEGKRLLSISNDRRVSFWEPGSDKLKIESPPVVVETTTQNARSSRQEIVFPPDVQLPPHLSQLLPETQIQAATEKLIGGIDNKKFCIWEAETGKKIWESDSETEPNNQIVDFLSDGIASTYSGSPNEQPSLSFNPNGRFFATSDGRGSLRIYRVIENKRVELILEEVMKSVTKMEFSPDGHSALLVYNEGRAQLRDLDKNTWTNLALSSSAIRRITFSADGSIFLVDVGVYQPQELWNVTSGSLIKTTGPIAGDRFFCKDNKTIATVMPEDDLNTTILRVSFWNVYTDSVVSTRSIKFGEITSYIVNPNGESMLTIGASGIARLWSLTPASSPEDLIRESSRIMVSDISEDGQVIVTANTDHSISVWNANNLKRVYRASNVKDFSFAEANGDFIYELVVSSLGKYICLKTFLGKFSVRDLYNDREIKKGEFGNTFARAFSFSPNGDAFAVVDRKDGFTVWKGLTKNASSTFIKVPNIVTKFVFSPDSQYLAAVAGLRSEDVKIFEVASGKEMELPREGFTSIIAFGPNGKIIGTVKNDDKAVQIWDLSKRSSLQKLQHTAGVTAVALNADGTKALTSTSDGNLQLWDINHQQPIASGPCSTRILSLKFGDGTTAIALSDKWIHIHSTDGANLNYVDGRQIASPEPPLILDGNRLRSTFPPLQNSLEVKDIDFSPQPASNTNNETMAGVFEEWTKKLGLTFDADGRLTEMRPGN